MIRKKNFEIPSNYLIYKSALKIRKSENIINEISELKRKNWRKECRKKIFFEILSSYLIDPR